MKIIFPPNCSSERDSFFIASRHLPRWIKMVQRRILVSVRFFTLHHHCWPPASAFAGCSALKEIVIPRGDKNVYKLLQIIYKVKLIEMWFYRQKIGKELLAKKKRHLIIGVLLCHDSMLMSNICWMAFLWLWKVFKGNSSPVSLSEDRSHCSLISSNEMRPAR